MKETISLNCMAYYSVTICDSHIMGEGRNGEWGGGGGGASRILNLCMYIFILLEW